MTYCTNCGKENSKKICPHCGVKRNKMHKYCEWCGNEIAEKAIICTNCGEKIKGGKIKGFFKLLLVALLLMMLATLLFSTPVTSPVPSTFFMLAALILLLPFVKRIIRKYTVGKKRLKTILKTARILLVAAFFVIGMKFWPTYEAIEYSVYTEDALRAAEVVFHEEVKLNNEQSFVRNGGHAWYETTPYNENENLRKVYATLDYSAENIFGGMARKTYKVEMLFDVTNGYYYRMNGKRIK